MGGFWNSPIPTFGEIGSSLKNKFGKATSNLAGQVQAATLAQKYGQGGFDAAPDNDPSASAIAPKRPSAKIQPDALAPNVPASSLREKFGPRESQGLTPAILGGAYQDQGGYGEFGSSGPRSLAQTLRDKEAAALLDESYGARMKANEAFAPDYQADALKAKVRDAEYEANSEAPRPLYSSGDTLGSFYKTSDGAFSNTPSGPTLKQQFAMQQDRLKNGDKILDLGRGELAGQLHDFRTKLDTYVQKRIPYKGRILSPADADTLYAQALKETNDQATILKPGFPPADQLGSAIGVANNTPNHQ